MVPVYFPVPIGAPPAGVFSATLSVWARCSPAGVGLSPALVGGKLLPKGQGGATVILSTDWQKFEFKVVGVNGSMPLGPGKPTLLSLRLGSPFATGGRVWVDELSLRCEKGTATQPCPSMVV